MDNEINLEKMLKIAGVEINEAVSQQALLDRLIKSMRLFIKKADSGGSLFINGELPPALRKQMKSIVNQAKTIEL